MGFLGRRPARRRMDMFLARIGVGRPGERQAGQRFGVPQGPQQEAEKKKMKPE